MKTNEMKRNQDLKDSKLKQAVAGGAAGVALGGLGTFAASAAVKNHDEDEAEETAAAEDTATEETPKAETHTSDHSHSHTHHEAQTHHASQHHAHHSAKPAEEVEVPEKEIVDGEDPEVEILGVEQIDNGEGGESNIGVASINGQAVYFIDVDGEDDEFEAMASDLNANGSLEEDEIIDISDQHIHVSQFEQLAEANAAAPEIVSTPEEYYAANDDLPDYVNDADPADIG